MDKGKVRQTVNVLAVVVTVALNALANALPLNDLTTGEISDRFDVYFTPAGYVFTIWALIYLGLGVFAVYQAAPSRRDDERLQRAGYFFALSCVANVAWLFLWHYELFPLTLVAMVALLLLLIAVYTRLRIGLEEVSWQKKLAVDLPFSIYLGWITVATIANVTSLLDFWGWEGGPISPEIWTVIILLVATGISSTVAVTRGDVAYVLVIVWAFIGIGVKHADTPLVSYSAWAAAALNGVMAVVGPVLHRHRV